MPIEIRELLIKVKIEEELSPSTESANLEEIKRVVLKECKKEIKKQLSKHKER